MDKLTYELRSLCKQNRDGSHGTQAQRLKQLKLFATQLKQLGYKHMGVRSLKTKHVKALVANWLNKPSKQTNKPISLPIGYTELFIPFRYNTRFAYFACPPT